MAAEFVALAELLRTPVAAAEPAREAAPIATAATHEPRAADDAVAHECVRDALHAARLYRARLADALDAAVPRLLRELASDVLVRELRLAPCDLAALVKRAAECVPIVRARVATCDVTRTRRALSASGCEVAVVEDLAIAAGDAIVELAGGELDARLGVRLAALLEAFA